MARFEVNFADPKGFYYPGETIVGNITASLQQMLEFHKFCLKFKGKSYCHWTTGAGDDKKSHWNHEEYFKEEIILLIASPPSNLIHLGPGLFNYPFSFKLPNNLPPTIDVARRTGYVRYYMKIKFDVDTWRLKSDVQEKIPFKVVAAPVDLGQLSHLFEPASRDKDKFLCCLCCKSGPIRLRCQINKQAFSIGEPIVFSFELDNRNTEKDLRDVEARLMAVVTLISNTSRRETYDYAVSSVLLTEGLQAGTEESWQNMQMNTPNNLIPNFDNCKCLHVSYKFLVEVDIPAALDPEVSFPITIATTAQTTQPVAQPPLMPPLPHFGTEPYPGTEPPAGDMHLQAYPPPVTVQPSAPEWIPTQSPPPYPSEEFK